MVFLPSEPNVEFRLINVDAQEGSADRHGEWRPPARGYSAVRLELIKADVVKSLQRQDLSIEGVVRNHHLSPRQVQRLFFQSGATFTEFVLEQRLSLAYRPRRDPGHFHRKVSDIAHSSGFGDLSYFNREFRRRFGETPHAIRDTGRNEAGP